MPRTVKDRVFTLAHKGDLNIHSGGVSLQGEDGLFTSATWTEIHEVAEAASENEAAVAQRMLDLGWEKEPITVDTATRTNGATYHVTMTGDWTGLSHMRRRLRDEGGDLPTLRLAEREAQDIRDRLAASPLRPVLPQH